MREKWFEKLFGFTETDPETVYRKLDCRKGVLKSAVNGRSYRCGELSVPSLAELRATVNPPVGGRLTITEVVGDVMELHVLPDSAGALFQAASQFNLLEMVSPHVSPADGVSRYAYDRTQGPACAIACGAGTVYRNYFFPLNGGRGQVSGTQVDCLSDLGDYLGNQDSQLWQMRNGYCLANEPGLRRIADQLTSFSDRERKEAEGLLRVGVHRDTEVTLERTGHSVTQAYCSALPVAYSPLSPALWAPFARLVLNATYEATLLAGLENYRLTGNPRVYLTLVGGGAFGNTDTWIVEAVVRALDQFREAPLEVVFVSYGGPDRVVKEIRSALNA